MIVADVLIVVGQLADVDARCFGLPNARRFSSALPVAVLVVFVRIPPLHLRLGLSAKFMGKSASSPSLLGHIPAIVVAPHYVFADRSHAHVPFRKLALFVVHVGSLSVTLQSGPLRDLCNLRFHLLERSRAVFERNLVTKGFRQKRILGG